MPRHANAIGLKSNVTIAYRADGTAASQPARTVGSAIYTVRMDFNPSDAVITPFLSSPFTVSKLLVLPSIRPPFGRADVEAGRPAQRAIERSRRSDRQTRTRR
ncbi:MAG: hypothetical protein ACTHMM_14920 [Agriterribacter sp.]